MAGGEVGLTDGCEDVWGWGWIGDRVGVGAAPVLR